MVCVTDNYSLFIHTILVIYIFFYHKRTCSGGEKYSNIIVIRYLIKS